MVLDGERTNLFAEAKGIRMLTLTEQQCTEVGKMEDDDLIKDTARQIRKKNPQVTESDIVYLPRLKIALEYANSLPLIENNVRRDFMLIETFYPGFYLKPDVDKWLRTPNGYSADQRFEDFKHVVFNRERRGL